MAGESDPPRKFYQLKPKEFERTNAPAGSPALPSEIKNPARPSATSAPFGGPELAPHSPAHLAPLSSHAPVHPPTDIPALLKQNLEHANAAGLNQCAPTAQRPSRRKKDYLLAMLAGNAALLVGTVIMPPFGIAGLILFNVGLTWVMWFVMDDY